jgi:cobalt-zinc-cadmium efflux system outer membrane protein
MRQTTRALVAIMLIVGAGGGLAAQTQSPQASIEALVQIALVSSPVMTEARAGVDVARADRLQAGLRPNPTAVIDRRQQSDGRETQTSIGLALPLDLFRTAPRAAVADHDVRVAEARVEATAVERAFLVRQQAARLLAARRLVTVLRSQADAMRSRVDLLTARVEVGAGRPLDRDMAIVEWRRAEAEHRRQEGGAEAALAELKALVGVPADADVALTLSLEDEVALTPSAPLAAESVRPDVRILDESVRRAEAERVSAVAEGRWNLQLSATYMNRAMEGVRVHEGMVGVMVDLPWRNRQQGAVAAASARGRAARAALENARMTAATDVMAARARLSAAEAVLSRYGDEWITTAAANLAVMREAWSLGDVTLLDVIEEERRFWMTQVEYTDALREVVEGRAMVRVALGVR